MIEERKSLDSIISCFEQYYDIIRDNVEPPFYAEAAFRSHHEKYILLKSAKIADIDSNEFVFFYEDESLSKERINELVELSWQRGLSRVRPYSGHRNTDVTLIVLAKNFLGDAFTCVKKISRYKSYKLGFYGWSSFRLLAYESNSGKVVTNRRGSDLRKIF